MRSKWRSSICRKQTTHVSAFLLIVTELLAGPLTLASAADNTGDPHREISRFLGTASCATAGCHGGAGEKRHQHLVWSTRDFHSLRPYATLTTARSKQIANSLGMLDPTRDTRCTSCHAPHSEVPGELQLAKLNPSEGVSCESCHGPAEKWIRSHTRPDLSSAQRAVLGLRDLTSPYIRANTCVACHQTVELSLLKAGHPELIFELDGQCVSEPRHWRLERERPGPQLWLVGQAAALRELSWQVCRDVTNDTRLRGRWEALLWLLRRGAPDQLTASEPAEVHESSDALAHRTSDSVWQSSETERWFSTLVSAAPDFRDTAISQPIQARRAERLVIALERLCVAKNLDQKLRAEINELFALVHSLPDFDPARFATALERLAKQSAS